MIGCRATTGECELRIVAVSRQLAERCDGDVGSLLGRQAPHEGDDGPRGRLPLQRLESRCVPGRRVNHALEPRLQAVGHGERLTEEATDPRDGYIGGDRRLEAEGREPVRSADDVRPGPALSTSPGWEVAHVRIRGEQSAEPVLAHSEGRRYAGRQDVVDRRVGDEGTVPDEHEVRSECPKTPVRAATIGDGGQRGEPE